MSEPENPNTEIQDSSSNPTCPNCQTILPSDFSYCNSCGQKQGTKRRSLYQLFKEFLDNFFNLDARIWRTLLNIFVPGKLTKEYFRGRHQSYSHPIRLFVLTSIALFSVISFKGLNFINVDLETELLGKTERSVYFEEFIGIVDSISNDLKIEQPNERTSLILDSLENRLPGILDSDSTYIGTMGKNWKFSTKDVVQLKEKEIIEKYEIDGFWNQIIVRQFLRTLKNSNNFAKFIWSNLPIMLLIMMPGVAFLLKLLYFRRDYYFVEHLVFSFHIHAFLFLLMCILLLVPSVSAMSILSGLSILVFLVYLYFAFKNFYGQSRLKTMMKLGAGFIGYFFLSMIAMLLTFLISALIF